MLIQFLAAILCAGQSATQSSLTPFDHVLLVSVDGLRPDAIDGPEDGSLPGFTRLLRGPHTFQARSDADMTVTLPNHVSMVTSRPYGGVHGHGWAVNIDPPAALQGGTIHAKHGAYVASVFDVAHDHGLTTAIVATKSKFSLLSQSFDDVAGADDSAGADDGKDKVDIFACVRTSRMAQETAFGVLAAHPPRSLTFIHFGIPDAAGHASGWDMAAGSQYRQSIAEVDTELNTLLNRIDKDPALRGKVAVVLTADHGGGVPLKSHTEAKADVNFLIPFIVWLGADGESTELTALNADTRAVVPANLYVDNSAQPQPIRNAEAGNLVLQLLGLPAIPGSLANKRQDLRLTPAPQAKAP